MFLVPEEVAPNFLEGSKHGEKLQYPPRLRRIKYDPKAQAPPSPAPSVLLGKETPIWGGVYTRFRDVDGNSFGLVSFDEVTHAVEEHRRTVALKQEAEHRAAQALDIAKLAQARLFPPTQPPPN